MLKIPYFVKEIIHTLEENGYEAYVVGGAVRDSLLGLTPTDYDVTTSCPPEKILELFENTVPTGFKHGTVTVIIDRIPTEVTTFRIDGAYSAHRSPDSVTFTGKLADDLSRRDFTVNALAFNEKSGLVDLFGGRLDLNGRVIKTVGEPQRRFNEDALRIMRAIRFSCALNFNIKEETYNAAVKFAHTLSLISPERIYAELTKTLLGQNLELLERFIKDGGLKFLNISECNNLNLISRLPSVLSLRMFAFEILCGISSGELEKRLKFNNNLFREIEYLRTIKNDLTTPNKAIIKKLLAKTNLNSIIDYLDYIRIFENKDITVYNELLNEIAENNEPYLISHLAVGGEDLIKHGFMGAEIGIKLNCLLEFVIENPELNTRKELLKRL